MPDDKLEKMFELQEAFQNRLGNDLHAQEFKVYHTLAAVVELCEFIQETPWKPWKSKQTYNIGKAREELVDIWHFLINLSLSVGLDAPGLYAEFLKKHKVNNERQDSGY